MNGLVLYLIAANAASFIIHSVDCRIRKRGGRGVKPRILANVFTIAGGALGAILAFVIWDRELNKGNLMSRIYAVIWLLAQLAVCLAAFGPNAEYAGKWFSTFYTEHSVLCIYLAAINAAAFVIFMIDKLKAVMGRWRVREVLLLGIALAGGAFGGWLAMDLCNHKVNTEHFAAGIPMMVALHMTLLFCVAVKIF